MKLNLTHKEANIVMAILWELTAEDANVLGGTDLMFRLTDSGKDITADVIRKLEDANEEAEAKSGKDRDLSGAPKGSIQEAVWKR